MENERLAIIRELRSKSNGNLLQRLERPTVPPTKSAEETATLIKKSDFLYERQKHGHLLHASIMSYSTRSLGHAPPGSEAQAKAYANRSRILLHLSKYRECLDDCQRGLSISACSDFDAVMMLCRQLECRLQLGLDGVKETYDVMQRRYLKLRDVTTDSADDQLRAAAGAFVGVALFKEQFKPEAANNAFPVRRVNVPLTHEAVRIAQDHKGLYLAAARNIHAGEIVLAEECYVTTMGKGVEGHHCCRYCLKLAWNVIPCNNCFNFFYCSERCRDRAWIEYHEIECALLHCLFSAPMYTDLDGNITLAMRIILRAFKETGSVAKMREIVKEVDSNEDLATRGMTDGEFRPNFKAFYSLTGPTPFDTRTFIIYTIAFYTVALVKHTKILGPDFSFDSCSDLARDHDVVFIGSLFLKFAKMTAIYGKYIDTAPLGIMEHDGAIIYTKMGLCFNGAGLAPYASLISHSCCPNVHHIFTHDGKLMYYSMLPIPKDTRISESFYLPFYSTKTPEERRHFLRGLYGFECHCDACVYKWGSTPPCDDKRVENFGLKPADFAHIDVAGPRIADLVSYLPALLSNNLELIIRVREAVAVAIEDLSIYPFPNPVTIALCYALRFAFDRCYSHMVHEIEDDCNDAGNATWR